MPASVHFFLLSKSPARKLSCRLVALSAVRGHLFGRESPEPSVGLSGRRRRLGLPLPAASVIE